MKKYLIEKLRLLSASETIVLSIVAVLLLLAAIKPSVPIKHDIHTYLFVIDITQSMNAEDMPYQGKQISRVAFTKKILKQSMSQLPCNTKVGIGMFSGVNVVALYTPIEVCDNFSAIIDTLDHIDWRSAWTADSRIRESMVATTQVLNNFTEPTQVIFFTDGEEAPKLHAFNTRDLSTLQGADSWLIVGVGSEKGAPIPRYDDKNQLTGYWSIESMQLAPGAAPIAAAGMLKRKSDTAESEKDRYISTLAESHLKTIASEIGAQYVRIKDAPQLVRSIKSLKSIRNEWGSYRVDWVLAALSVLLLLSIYIPRKYFSRSNAFKPNTVLIKQDAATKHQLSNEMALRS